MKGKTGKKMIIRGRIRSDEEVRKLNCSGTVRFKNDILKQFEENARKAGGVAHCRLKEQIRRITTPEGNVTNRLNEAVIHTI